MSRYKAFAAVLFGLGGSAAHAGDVYVDPLGGLMGMDGRSPGTAVPTIRAGLALAQSGDVIHIAEGTYAETVRLQTPSLTLQGSGEVVVVSEASALVVETSGVVVDGLTLRGGERSAAAVEVRNGGTVQMSNSHVEAVAGPGVTVSGNRAKLTFGSGEVDAGEHRALVVSDGGSARVQDAVIRGFGNGAGAGSLVDVSGFGTAVTVAHTLVTGASGSCVRASDTARLAVHSSIIGSCGMERDEAEASVAVAQASDARVEVTRSLIQGQARAPHEQLFSGTVTVDALSRFNGALNYVGEADSVGFLSIAVDDVSDLEQARSLAEALQGTGARITFFVDAPEQLTEAELHILRELMDMRHEVALKGTSGGLLTEEAPIAVQYDGSGAAVLEVYEEGRFLRVGTDTEEWVNLDLTSTDHDTIHEVCDALDALESLQCGLSSGGTAHSSEASNPTGLLDGAYTLPAEVQVPIAWDRRLPSEGGRHFTHALVAPRELLSDRMEFPIVSLAYPDHQHDETVRAAAREAGFLLARGDGTHAGSDHRFGRAFDPMQAPLSISAEAVRGPDFDALSEAQQEERVRAFARNWQTYALEAGAMGVLTIPSLERFGARELGWLMDVLDRGEARVWTMAEVGRWLQEHSTEQEDGLWVGLSSDFSDYRPGAGSDAVDGGLVDADRSMDALGQPIYGKPDMGPFEHQPAGVVGVHDLVPGVSSVIYADGRFLEPAVQGASLSIRPVEGWPELSHDTVRDVWASVLPGAWGPFSRAWSVSGVALQGASCAGVGNLEPLSTWTVEVNGEPAGSFTANRIGQVDLAMPAGAQRVRLTRSDATGEPARLCAEADPPVEADTRPERVEDSGDADAPYPLADEPSGSSRPPKAGGCSVAAGSGPLSWGLVGLTTLLAGLRRRRD